MTKIALPVTLTLTLTLAGCGGGGGPLFDFGGGGGGLGGLFGGREEPEEMEVVITDTPGEGLAAGAPGNPVGEARFLGLSVASLGDAADPGLWAETPYVSEVQPGRIIGEDGTVVRLTLRPSGGERGSGTRLSVQAMQGLGVALTALPTVTVLTEATES